MVLGLHGVAKYIIRGNGNLHLFSFEAVVPQTHQQYAIHL